MDAHTYENAPTEPTTSQQQPTSDIPRITIENPDQTHSIEYHSDSASDTETEMSSTHRSSRHSSKDKHSHSHSYGHSSSKTKSKKDDWSEITDPEERRRVQNRIAQRKFRDKAKETKERQERDEENRTHAGHSYHTADANDMGTDEELSGLPWGSLSLKHVVSKGKAREEESRRGSRTDRGGSGHGGSRYEQPVYGEREGYYEGEQTYYDDKAYYDYGSGGSGHGGSSR